MSKKRRLIISLIILLLGLFLSLWTYFSPKGSIHPVGYITDTTIHDELVNKVEDCLLYTSPSPRDRQKSRMPSSA